MKLQHLAVIFIIIVLPLTLILSAYTNRQIDTLTLQQQYDTKLMDATYDGIKAFEINATYNDLSNVSDTLREDVEAAISTFMGSMASSLGVSGYREDEIKPYVPAILFTLYDGYYIYSPTRVANADGALSNKYEYMLKPYNYYTVRYKDRNNSNYDVVINYTLDNYIVVYGWINGDYVTKSGYLVTNRRDVTEDERLVAWVPVKYIGNEDKNIEISKREITSNDYNPDEARDDRTEFLYPRNEAFYVAKDSAITYYTEAKTFTDWVTDNLKWVTPNMAMRNGEYLSGKNNSDSQEYSYFTDSTTKIFREEYLKANDPEDRNSAFAEHKTAVIRTSIQDNLNQAITEYSEGSTLTYEFRLPKLSSDEWNMVSSNICMLTFFQGLPVGTKYYNNYSLVASSNNKLYVTEDNLYFTTDNDNYYHKIDCPELCKNNDTTGLVGYTAFDYQTKRVKIGDTYTYYHKHNINKTESKKACYYCILNSNYKKEDWQNEPSMEYRRIAFYTALAREKQSRYATTSYFGT